jgi:homoserine kinase
MGVTSMSSLRYKNEVTVKVPGSIANLGPGFDVFALALKKPYDLMNVKLTNEKGVRIEVNGSSSEKIPTNPKENTAGLSTQFLIDRYDIDYGVKVRIEKGIKPGYGLGSSGADAAAVVYALNHLFDLVLTRNEMVEIAAMGEIAASNTAHADNVSASLLGGFTVVRSYEPLDVLCCQPPENLGICITTPRINTPQKKTAAARLALPERILLEQLTHTVGNATSLLYGMLTSDISLMGKAMNDCIVEPVRSKFIPGYKYVKEGALKKGAAGVVICGAGPSIAAFYDNRTTKPGPILEGMAHGFKIFGIDSDQLTTQPGTGAEFVVDNPTFKEV